MNMNVIFCNNLKEARKANGFTQRTVAQSLGVVESCYANWEQGRTEPDISYIISLAKFFDVTADILLGIKEY